MKKQERDFKGVWIPKGIWLNKDLNLTEKLLLVGIDMHDVDTERGCTANNATLAEFVSVKHDTVLNLLTRLKKKGYIHQLYFDGRIRGLCVNHPNLPRGFSQVDAPFPQKRNHPPVVYPRQKLKNLRGNTYQWAKTRKLVFERDNHTCTYCGSKAGPFECDHIIPFSKGGSNDPSNLTTSCQLCNKQKSDRSLDEFLAWRADKS